MPIPDPNKPEEHDPWCIYGVIETGKAFIRFKQARRNRGKVENSKLGLSFETFFFLFF